MVEFKERIAFNCEVPLEARASLLLLQQKRPVEEILFAVLKNSSEFGKLLRTFEDMEISRCKRTLTILNVHYAIDFNLLTLLFEEFGEILSIYIFKDKGNEKSPGFCTIEFFNISSAESAIKCMQDFVVYGLPLKIFQTEHIQSVRSSLLKQSSLSIGTNIPSSSAPSLFSQAFVSQSLLSNYNPSRIYIGSIPWEMTEKEVSQLFSPFGKILKLEMMPNPETGKHKGFAFLVFEALSSAYKAIQAMNNYSVKNQRLRVNFQSSASPLMASSSPPAPSSSSLTTAVAPGGVGGVGVGGGLIPIGGVASSSSSSLLGLPGSIPSLLSSSASTAPSLLSSKPTTLPIAPPIHSPVLMLRNMVVDDADFDDDTREEITKECSKFGIITELLAKTVTVINKTADGKGEKIEKEEETTSPSENSQKEKKKKDSKQEKKEGQEEEKKTESAMTTEFRIFLVFSREEDAIKAAKGLNGRWYAQRMVDACAYDYEAYLKKEYDL